MTKHSQSQGHGDHMQKFDEFKPGQAFFIGTDGQKHDPEGKIIEEAPVAKAKFTAAELEGQDKDTLAKLAEANGIKVDGLTKPKLIEALAAIKE
jgi:hypothetical protein